MKSAGRRDQARGARLDGDRRRYNALVIETRAQQFDMFHPVQQRNDRVNSGTMGWNRVQRGNELVCLDGYPEHIHIGT